MQTATLQELKKELQSLPPKELAALCIALAKYKKDNKEYLDYLMFQSQNPRAFLVKVKQETDRYFEELKEVKNLYYIKKGLRKVLRVLNKYGKYLGEKSLKAEILIYFCQKLKASGISIHKSAALEQLFEGQIKKINALLPGFHEDLQSDFKRELEMLIDY